MYSLFASNTETDLNIRIFTDILGMATLPGSTFGQCLIISIGT